MSAPRADVVVTPSREREGQMEKLTFFGLSYSIVYSVTGPYTLHKNGKCISAIDGVRFTGLCAQDADY